MIQKFEGQCPQSSIKIFLSKWVRQELVALKPHMPVFKMGLYLTSDLQLLAGGCNHFIKWFFVLVFVSIDLDLFLTGLQANFILSKASFI